jgi:small subunit ribosomal protein S3
VKVWIYKGDILPYKSAVEDKIAKEAAMAVGETAGPGRRVISAGGGRRRPEPDDAGISAPATGDEDDAAAAKPLLGEADPELERLLAEEEEIERRTREHHETPHFRGGED